MLQICIRTSSASERSVLLLGTTVSAIVPAPNSVPSAISRGCPSDQMLKYIDFCRRGVTIPTRKLCPRASDTIGEVSTSLTGLVNVQVLDRGSAGDDDVHKNADQGQGLTFQRLLLLPYVFYYFCLIPCETKSCALLEFTKCSGCSLLLTLFCCQARAPIACRTRIGMA